MYSRIRTALGLMLLLTLFTSITVFAKGSFAFITIHGPEMKEPIRSTDPALTTDFFAFADYYQDRIGVPDDPGMGNEVTRYYVDGGRETAFDRLHYYPEKGFVYYDGIVNGSSEYDGEWYKAKSEIKPTFLDALSAAPAAEPDTKSSVPQPQSVEPNTPAQPEALISKIQPMTPIAIVGSLVVFATVLFWRRKSLVS